MSKFFESLFEFVGSLFSVLIWGGLLCVICIAWDSGWSLSEYFSKSDKTEKWLNLENKDRGSYYTKGLDEDWVSLTSGGLTVKGKMRKSLQANDNRYEFAYKVNAKLTNPKLKPDFDNKIVENYEFSITFYCIDEDGFIIDEFTSRPSSSLEHEEHESYIKWTPEKYPNEDIEVTSAAIYRYIPEGIAKRVHKISYVPTIKAKIEDKGNVDDAFDKILKEKNQKTFDWDLYDQPQEPVFPSSFREINKTIKE